MFNLKKIAGLAFVLFLMIQAPAPADINFPYTNLKGNLPVYEEPFNGMGNYYSSLSNGIRTVLWNPAGIMKIPTVETSATFPLRLGSFSFTRKTNIEDTDFTAGASSLVMGVYWTNDLGDLTKKTRSMFSQVNDTSGGATFLFDQALRFSDNFAVGVRALGPIDIQSQMAGDFPLTSRYTASFKNVTDYGGKGVSTDVNGKLSYTYSSGSLNYTYTTENPLWEGFLTQNLDVPAKAVSSLQNSVNVSNSMVITGGYQAGNFRFGLNVVPISATAVIDNSVQVVINKTASDLYFYTPNFDPNDEKTVADWTMDQNLYGTSRGYTANTINIPNGEVVMDGRYRGTYTGSATRMDLGVSMDMGNGSVLSVVSENFNSASLNMKGTGISYYANQRFNTTSIPNIDPVSGIDWKPFNDGASDITFKEGQGLYMEPQKTFQIPKRIRVGFSTPKPFLLAIDYEMLTTPVNISITGVNGLQQSVAINGLNVLRIGGELQVLRSPVFLRGGFGILFKPTSDNADVQTKINNYFKIGGKSLPVFPAKADIGLSTNIYGTNTGIAFGLDALSLINMYEIDVTYSNIGKALFYTLYANRDNWQLSYIASADIAGTYADLQAQNKPIGKASLSDIKWNQTIAVSYRF